MCTPLPHSSTQCIGKSPSWYFKQLLSKCFLYCNCLVNPPKQCRETYYILVHPKIKLVVVKDGYSISFRIINEHWRFPLYKIAISTSTVDWWWFFANQLFYLVFLGNTCSFQFYQLSWLTTSGLVTYFTSSNALR